LKVYKVTTKTKMTIEKFEDIISWQKARELSVLIYNLLKTNRDFSFNDQIKRAVVSISNNIAEGFERRSNKEFKQFLFIAKGSCAEVRSMLYIGSDLGYFKADDYKKCYNLSVDTSKLLSGLIKTL